jgi:Putative transposase/Transposase zinc-binding domain
VQTSPLEVADIFRTAGAGYRAVQAGRLSLAQLKVMSAIETCRTAALGGHVEGCDDCGHLRVAYNSCRNRHCPKCQGAAARTWLAEREADLLPVGYFHVVFTLPGEVADIAWQNKAVVYDLLFRAASETMVRIAADPRHLGARIGITAVLHTWGSAMTHHPHVHMIVPGGGIATAGSRWIGARPAFLLPVRVLAKLFRRLFLTQLLELHAAGKLAFFGQSKALGDRRAFVRHVAPLRNKRWQVYAKAPFAGPEAVLAYLARYTHRVAIANRRLIAFDETGVTFRYKDYRRTGLERQQVMTLETHEFIRRFLLHVLPRGFHRIRHYGLLASSTRKASIARARELLATSPPAEPAEPAEPSSPLPPCPCCGGRMRIIEIFGRWSQPRAPPQAPTPTGTVPS